MNVFLSVLLLSTAAVPVAPPAVVAVAPVVVVTPLTVPSPADDYVEPTGLNERGEVAGRYVHAGTEHHGVWRDGSFVEIGVSAERLGHRIGTIADNGRVAYTRITYPEVDFPEPGGRTAALTWLDGTSRELQPFGATESEAVRIDRTGTKVAMQVEYAGFLPNRLAVWDNGVIRAAPASVDHVDGIIGINRSGQVLFHRFTSDSGWLYAGGQVTELTGFRGSAQILARSINDSGQVFGDDGKRAFLWQTGTFTDLGTLGGQETRASTRPQSLNDAGEAVGESATADGSWHAFVWRAGSMTDLGTLPGDVSSEAVAINNAGQIFGVSVGPDRARHPVLWQDGRIHDLTRSGAGFDEIGYVNDRGQLLVTGIRDELWTVTVS